MCHYKNFSNFVFVERNVKSVNLIFCLIYSIFISVITKFNYLILFILR